jgi:uncharacterized protein with FMN-binding domain
VVTVLAVVDTSSRELFPRRTFVVKKTFYVAVGLVVLITALARAVYAQQPTSLVGADSRSSVSKSSQAKVLGLLEANGASYTKVRDGVWSVTYTGTHTQTIEVRVAVAEDLVVFVSCLADRSDFRVSPDLLGRFLEFNSDIDSVKLGFTDDQVMIRLDMHVRLLDEKEWQYALEQVAAAMDEAVGRFKNDLKPVSNKPRDGRRAPEVADVTVDNGTY